MLLFLPVCIISVVTYAQFEKDQRSQYHQQSDKMSAAINKRLFKRRTLPNAIKYSEFNYYQHLYNPINKQLSQVLSPLSNADLYQHTNGLIGYFQTDSDGNFSSPVWPYPLNSLDDQQAVNSSKDIAFMTRRALAIKLQAIVNQSQKVDMLNSADVMAKRELFTLITDVPDYFIFYRVVSLNSQLKMQGYVVNRLAFLSPIIKNTINITQFNKPINIVLQDTTQKTFNYLFSHKNQQDQVTTTRLTQSTTLDNQWQITRSSLNRPFGDYQLSYVTSELAFSSTAVYGLGLIALLLVAIVVGCYGFYRIGLQQLTLAEQRLNFVSSVSHELKTPLTSIRMYSEMLKTGTLLSQEHQLEYYEFIHSESERLSRLIDNILQLATLNQPEQSVNLQYVKLSILQDIIRSKVSSLFEANDFELSITQPFEQPDKINVLVDNDAFSQVIINITDNAIKFFNREEIADQTRQKIDFIFSQNPTHKDQLHLEVRDYGQGITVEQENKIFELFYRGGSELTRTTQGTGIGLALVHELMSAQNGTIQVKRMNPGLSMIMTLKCKH
ncbi:MAG: hypothetical protein BM565_09665 [Gammaproteobacteria bacterium MedPE]|nr:MAG: hypothetical protein BM565_09665 [Gammaproteobacteria bacterium MedPE]